MGIGLLGIVAVSLFNITTPMQHLELMASDFVLYYRELPHPTGHVVIASIDERSIAEFGRWPWPRTIEARLVDSLNNYHVAAIGFDMAFSERDTSANDLAFARAIAAGISTYIGYFFNSHPMKDGDLFAYKRTILDPPPITYGVVRKEPGAYRHPPSAYAYLPPISELNSAAHGTSFLNVDEDLDGMVRSYPVVVSFDGLYCVPLFLTIADAYLHGAPLRLDLADYGVARVAVGDQAVPVDEIGRMTLHYRGPAGAIPRYSVSDIVDHRIEPDKLAGKAVVVGVTAQGLGDRFATPVGSDFPGVEILATAADDVIGGDFIQHSLKTKYDDELISWALGMAIAITAALTSAVFSLAMMLVLSIGYLNYMIFRLALSGTQVGVVLPLFTLWFTYLVVMSHRYIAEWRHSEFLSRFLSPQLSRVVREQGIADSMQQNRTELSIVACDLRGFTAFSETAAPEDTMKFLHEYYEMVGKVVTKAGGSILGYAGDGIISVVGAPASTTDYAQRAVFIGLGILSDFEQLVGPWQRLGVQLGVGVGIASGFVNIGAIASADHLEYTAIGPPVNLAARLSSYAKAGQVLVDHRTVGLVNDDANPCTFENMGTAELKGFARPVPVFSARATALTPHNSHS
jgi:adenylate cyclase